MSSSIVNSIEQLALPIVEAKQAFIIDVKLRGDRGGKVVEVFIDTDEGVSTNVCAEISRLLSRELDVTGIMHGKFHLVVSSPGIDRPLKFPRQYPHHIGRTLTVQHRVHEQVQKTVGTLTQASPDGIELRLQNDSVLTLSFQDIVEAYVNAAW